MERDSERAADGTDDPGEPKDVANSDADGSPVRPASVAANSAPDERDSDLELEFLERLLASPEDQWALDDCRKAVRLLIEEVIRLTRSLVDLTKTTGEAMDRTVSAYEEMPRLLRAECNRYRADSRFLVKFLDCIKSGRLRLSTVRARGGQLKLTDQDHRALLLVRRRCKTHREAARAIANEIVCDGNVEKWRIRLIDKKHGAIAVAEKERERFDEWLLTPDGLKWQGGDPGVSAPHFSLLGLLPDDRPNLQGAPRGHVERQLKDLANRLMNSKIKAKGLGK